MSPEKEKSLKLLAFWMFGTVLIVFAALMTYVTMWARPIGATFGEIFMMILPILSITVILAIVLYGGYYFYVTKK